MPYNTRRKSLSLPSLGIHLPVTNAERAAARLSPPSAAMNPEHPLSEKDQALAQRVAVDVTSSKTKPDEVRKYSITVARGRSRRMRRDCEAEGDQLGGN